MRQSIPTGREPAPTGTARGRSPGAEALPDVSTRGQNLTALAQLSRQGPAAVAQRERLSGLFGDAAAIGRETAPRDLAIPTASPAQRMTVRNGAVAATVAGATHTKHVVAAGLRQADADGGFHSKTFVDSDADLTGPVDLDGHNFTEAANARSGRFDFNANVVIYQYTKANPGVGNAAALTIDGVATPCEIGVVKTGADALQVTHFMKV